MRMFRSFLKKKPSKSYSVLKCEENKILNCDICTELYCFKCEDIREGTADWHYLKYQTLTNKEEITYVCRN